MKVWILTNPRDTTYLFATENKLNEFIVQLAKLGKITGRVTVTTSELDVSQFPVLTEGPATDDYVIDDQGDRWDYFPHKNQYKLRMARHIHGTYNEGIGYQSQDWISRNYGLRSIGTNGTIRNF